MVPDILSACAAGVMMAADRRTKAAANLLLLLRVDFCCSIFLGSRNMLLYYLNDTRILL
jgi:hypothetical protein